MKRFSNWYVADDDPATVIIPLEPGLDAAAYCGTAEIAQLVLAAPETAAERDRLQALNADLVEALAEQQKYCSVCGGSGVMNLYGGDESAIGQAPGSADRDCTYCAKARAALAKPRDMEAEYESRPDE